MRKSDKCASILFCSVLAIAGNAAAQSITITPNYPPVVVGHSAQFSAQVTGLSSTAVVWSVSGIKGGNSTLGTITQTGLYTAPATVPQASALVIATSAVNSAVQGVMYPNILALGPTITAVSPNPFPVGTNTVTITGSGFKSGAMMYVSYGSNSLVQIPTATLTATTITASVYLGGASTAAFCVKNPGTDYSNSITVPLGYKLTVANGAGSGVYPVGTVVTITANAPPAGKVFSKWTGATVAGPAAATTTLTMPAAATTVTANYAAAAYALTVVNGTGSGTYPAGKVVTIVANAPPAGQVFLNWSGAAVANPAAATTTLTMPAANTTVTANYTAVPTYTLTVVNGAGSGNYAAGTVVPITANAPPTGQSFVNWTGAAVANANAATTTLTMPASNATVTANFAAVPTYTLTVVNGTGSGNYAAGTVVPITANAPPAGQSFVNWTGAAVANASAASTTITMPAANTAVTANFSAATTNYTLTVVNGTGSGSYASGTVVPIAANAPPAGQSFLNWTGAVVANPTAASTTITMPAANTTVTANYSTSTGTVIPYPVSTHPRLWITVSDLPRLRGWATAANPVYQNGLLPVLQTAVNVYNTQFVPNGVTGEPPATPNPNYPDPGDTQGYTGYLTEEYGAILALNSLVDPNQANRIQYAQMARNMLMYAMKQAARGVSAGLPFRDPAFAVYNRANGSGELWPLLVDWLYSAVDANNQPILTASDKLIIRNAFMLWANLCLTASTTGGDSPQVLGVYNSFQLLPGNLPYRMAANNYYTGHARLLLMMALAIDPSDDPPVNTGLAASAPGNSLRSYLSDALGAWMYQQYAMYQDGATVASQYGIPGGGAGFGLASGGLPPEGMLYGVSYGNLLGGLLALQTAGFNNPAYASYTGPQIGLLNAPMWDRFVKGIFASLTPAPFIATGSESYLGQEYQFASYGDLLRFYVTPDYMGPFALLALLEQQQGQTTHLNDARWFSYNVVQGGPPAFYTRMIDPYSFEDTILYFLLYDPAVSPAAATDPRPGYPSIFLDPGASRLVAHSDWTASGTMFDYRASWLSINHQDGNAGQFELYRKGEWLTKELSNYDNNGLGMTTYYHNSLGLQNTCPNGNPQSVIDWYEAGELANGSQWMLGMNAGDPTTSFSNGAGYIYANTDMTKLYNRPDIWDTSKSMMNITQATRSIVWLNKDYIVVYDRATSQSAGLFKRWYLTLITNPVINGHVATETLPSGQKLFVQSLLPAAGTLTARNVVADLTTIAELEPAQYVMTIQDTSNPIDVRFLHLLQGADAGAAMVPAAYLQSTAGTPMDGAVFGGAAVYFPVSGVTPFAGTTVSAPAGVHTLVVTGLAPNASVGYSLQPNGGGNTVVITAGGSGATADSAGLLKLTF